MSDFVIRKWILDPHPGNQAPRHVHHRGDEAFIVVAGRLEVEDSGVRHILGPGQLHVVEAGSVHTFATVGDEPVRLFCVMTPEIDSLVQALHDTEQRDDDRIWEDHNSERVEE